MDKKRDRHDIAHDLRLATLAAKNAAASAYCACQGGPEEGFLAVVNHLMRQVVALADELPG